MYIGLFTLVTINYNECNNLLSLIKKQINKQI